MAFDGEFVLFKKKIKQGQMTSALLPHPMIRCTPAFLLLSCVASSPNMGTYYSGWGNPSGMCPIAVCPNCTQPWQYNSGCGFNVSIVCTNCTNPLPPWSYYNATGGLYNACSYSSCQPCPAGQYNMGCSNASPGYCIPCQGLLPGNVWYVDSGYTCNQTNFTTGASWHSPFPTSSSWSPTPQISSSTIQRVFTTISSSISTVIRQSTHPFTITATVCAVNTSSPQYASIVSVVVPSNASTSAPPVACASCACVFLLSITQNNFTEFCPCLRRRRHLLSTSTKILAVGLVSKAPITLANLTLLAEPVSVALSPGFLILNATMLQSPLTFFEFVQLSQTSSTAGAGGALPWWEDFLIALAVVFAITGVALAIWSSQCHVITHPAMQSRFPYPGKSDLAFVTIEPEHLALRLPIEKPTRRSFVVPSVDTHQFYT